MENISNDFFMAGKLLYDEQKTLEAIEYFNKSIKFNYENRDAHIHLAYALCRMGDYKNGFRELAWVWRPIFGDQTGLLGKDKNLKDKTIVISADAGLGDSIMFSRFLKELRARNCRIILHVQEGLVKLFTLSNIADLVISHNDILPAHDLRIPFHSLMSALDIDESWLSEAGGQYLSYDNKDFSYYKEKMENKSRRKVGLCWQGNPDFVNDKLRSVTLDKLLQFTNPDDYLVSLVPGFSENNPNGIACFSMPDIAQTAALIKNLDIVYTVDTMICHLCGALGVPTVLLNRFNGCWRWGEGNEASIWYDSVKIMHQRRINIFK